VDHLRKNGFTVRAEDVYDLTPIKTRHGVPPDLQSCHTAVIGSYVIEGHVPATTINKLLKESPRIAGLAVPGMPAGSPGMDAPGQAAERYQVIAFDRTGRTSVYSTH
jgi:hypothetical protein